MSKPDLSTVEGVERWAESVACYLTHQYTPRKHECRDTETAAYIAEAVKFFEQHKDCECVKHTGNE